jgi:two-component system chemotaxis sensor kinase CheA
VLARARARGLVGDKDSLSREQALDLVFEPGFSGTVDASGRSAGYACMDMIRRTVGDLGGTIALESEPGLGSTVTIRLPLTRAVLDRQTASSTAGGARPLEADRPHGCIRVRFGSAPAGEQRDGQHQTHVGQVRNES